jgi:hypothetical protein
MYSSLVKVLFLSQILNIKLPSFVVLRRKERKKEDTLKVYRSQQRYTDLCTDSTDILPASVSVVAVNCDPFGSLAPPHYYRLPSCSVLIPRT